MKPSTKALLWEQARVSGVIAAWLLLVGGLMQLVLNLNAGTYQGMFSQDINQMSLKLNLMIGFMGAMLLMLRADGQGHLRFHFEPRHSRLPVQTPTLVFTIYSTRLLFIALLCGLLWILPRPVSTKEASNFIPLVPILSYAILQGLVWSYQRVIWVGYVLCLTCFVLLAVLIGIHLQDFITNARSSSLLTFLEYIHWEAVLLWSFVPGIMLSFLLGWLGVHYTRMDMQSGPPRISNLMEHIGYWFRPEVCRFKSPLAAQLWYEWRRIGYLLPLISITVLLFMTLGLSTMLALSPSPDLSDVYFASMLGITAQMLPYIAVVFAAMVAGAIAIRPKSRYHQLRPLALRHSALALMLAQWKALMFTLAGATILSVLGFILFDFVEVRFLWGDFLAGRISLVELISIFLGPLLLAAALGWTMLFTMTRYWFMIIVWINILFLLQSPVGYLRNQYRMAHETMEYTNITYVSESWLYDLALHNPPWFQVFYKVVTNPFALLLYFNILLLLAFLGMSLRKLLLHYTYIVLLCVVWLGLTMYLTAFFPGGFSWMQNMALNLGISAFLVAPFVATPLTLHWCRLQE